MRAHYALSAAKPLKYACGFSGQAAQVDIEPAAKPLKYACSFSGQAAQLDIEPAAKPLKYACAFSGQAAQLDIEPAAKPLKYACSFSGQAAQWLRWYLCLCVYCCDSQRPILNLMIFLKENMF